MNQSLEHCLTSNGNGDGPFALEWIPTFPDPIAAEHIPLIPADAHRFIGAVIDVMSPQFHQHSEQAMMWKRTPVLVQVRNYADVPTLHALVQQCNVAELMPKKRSAEADEIQTSKRSKVLEEGIAIERTETGADEIMQTEEIGESRPDIPEGHVLVYLYGSAQDRIMAYRSYEFISVPASEDHEETGFIAFCCWPVEKSPFVPTLSQFEDLSFKISQAVGLTEPMPVRSLLLDFIATFVSHGDIILAECVLLNLVSRVEPNNQAVFPPGKLSLNIDVKPESAIEAKKLCRQLEYLYSLLLPHSKIVELSLDSLTKRRFMPVKDMATEKVLGGDLHLVSGSSLIVDETSLKTGKLNAFAVKNLQVLNDVIQNQVVQVDFAYQTVRFPVSLPVVIVSEGSKSLLATDLLFRVTQATEHRSALDWTRIFNGNSQGTTAAVLDLFREYIRRSHQNLPSIPSELARHIENELVSLVASQPGTENLSEQDKYSKMHYAVNLARLLSSSYLEDSVSLSSWSRAAQIIKEKGL